MTSQLPSMFHSRTGMRSLSNMVSLNPSAGLHHELWASSSLSRGTEREWSHCRQAPTVRMELVEHFVADQATDYNSSLIRTYKALKIRITSDSTGAVASLAVSFIKKLVQFMCGSYIWFDPKCGHLPSVFLFCQLSPMARQQCLDRSSQGLNRVTENLLH